MDLGLSLCDDGIFRGIFGHETSAPFLADLVNAVLRNADDTQIRSLEITNPFQLKELLAQKESVLDIKAKDDQGRSFDVEVQVAWHKGFRERILFYLTRLYSRQLDQGNKYDELRPVIGIVFTKFPIWPDHPEILCDSFCLYSKNNPSRIYSDHIKIHFVTVPEQLDVSLPMQDTALLQWLKLLNYPKATSEEEMESISENNPFIKAALERTKFFLADPAVQDYVEGKRKFELIQASIQQTIAEENFEKGIEKGIVMRAVKDLLELIEWNIETPSDQCRTCIEGITDLGILDSLKAKVGKKQITSLDELEQELQNLG